MQSVNNPAQNTSDVFPNVNRFSSVRPHAALDAMKNIFKTDT